MTCIIFLLISTTLEIWMALTTADSAITVNPDRVGPGLLLPSHMPLVPVKYSRVTLEGDMSLLAWALVSHLKFVKLEFCGLGPALRKRTQN